jgi:microcompartment protein CcmK/EutM
MRIAKVIGTTISTIKSPRIKGTKLLICQAMDETGKKELGKPYAAVDLVDAGEGDLVLTCHGSASRQTNLTKDTPVDAVVMAVVDHLEVDGDVVFRKE